MKTISISQKIESKNQNNGDMVGLRLTESHQWEWLCPLGKKDTLVVFQRNFRFDSDKFAVSTIYATDRSTKQFETAIAPKTMFGEWKVVEMYDTFVQSEEGHKKWESFVCEDGFDLSEHQEVFANYSMDKSEARVITKL